MRSSARGRARACCFRLHGCGRSAAIRSGSRITGSMSGRVGKFERLAHAEGCRDVVFIGSLVRPALWQMRLDWTTLRVHAAHHRGLSRRRRSSAHGHRAHVRGEWISPARRARGGARNPDAGGRARARAADRARPRRHRASGSHYLRATGPFDIGQAVVVADKHVLAVEAAEGTDAMLARVAEMRAQRPHARDRPATGVLVKAPKPRAGPRASICPRSARGRSKAWRAPDLPASRSSPAAAIIAEPERLVAAADRAKIFVVGVRPAARRDDRCAPLHIFLVAGGGIRRPARAPR